MFARRSWLWVDVQHCCTQRNHSKPPANNERWMCRCLEALELFWTEQQFVRPTNLESYNFSQRAVVQVGLESCTVDEVVEMPGVTGRAWYLFSKYVISSDASLARALAVDFNWVRERDALGIVCLVPDLGWKMLRTAHSPRSSKGNAVSLHRCSHIIVLILPGALRVVFVPLCHVHVQCDLFSCFHILFSVGKKTKVVNIEPGVCVGKSYTCLSVWVD